MCTPSPIESQILDESQKLYVFQSSMFISSIHRSIKYSSSFDTKKIYVQLYFQQLLHVTSHKKTNQTPISSDVLHGETQGNFVSLVWNLRICWICWLLQTLDVCQTPWLKFRGEDGEVVRLFICKQGAMIFQLTQMLTSVASG